MLCNIPSKRMRKGSSWSVSTTALSRQEGSPGCKREGGLQNKVGSPALGETGRREAGGLFRRVISPGVL